MRDVYQEVTNKIIEQLEAGTLPWLKPWKSAGNGVGFRMPVNASTGKQYRGVNVLLLASVAAEYGDHRFLTFKQAKALGGSVRKGEHGTQVVFWKFLEVEGEDQGDGEEAEAKVVPMVRLYTVFNVAQCDGLKLAPLAKPAAPIAEAARNELLDAYLRKTGAQITEVAGDRAYYAPAVDAITLPTFAQFEGASHFYATAFHELAHWTGHESRLAREFGKRFSDQAYAAEELVAEMTAAFLCAEHGVTGELRHAGYIKNWLQVLRNDKRAVFTACSKAQAAADYLNAAFAKEERIAA
jgi:antirestriction protein ArdC